MCYHTEHMLENFLKELGFSDKETKVYLELLKVDNDSVLSLSKKTKLNRTTLYPVLQSLAKKGLISETTVDKKVRYLAEPPERLQTYIERQRVKLDEQKKVLKDIIPQLKSFQREEGERPVISYFEGKEGVISAMKDYFNKPTSPNDEAFFLSDPDLLNEVFTKQEIASAGKDRREMNIKSFTFFTSEKGETGEDTEISKFYKIDHEKYPILCDIGIYKDSVRIHTLGDKVSAIYIKSKDVATSLRSVFKLLRDTLEEKKK
jgi:sugar-specific transcriptional regulator TrmB